MNEGNNEGNDDGRQRGQGGRRLSRRGFLQGAGALASAPAVARPAGEAPYPPALQGLRGNHEGSNTFPHLLRDGALDPSAGTPQDTGERPDLVVVGAGLSGLSAAHFYRQRHGGDSRVLLLDNHDDFGGHARRNEFRVDGRLLLANAGTQSFDNPASYSPQAKRLLQEMGVRVQALGRDFDRQLYRRLGTACFFDAQTFGADRLVAGMGTRPWAQFLADAPLGERARADILRLYTERTDYLAGMDLAARKALLASTTYADFLVRHCGVDPGTLKFFQCYPHDLFGAGIDAVPALQCYENPDDYGSFTYPGFDGLGLEPPEEQEPYVFHFPDGNASLARLLVRSLVPAAVEGAGGMEDIVTARVRYERLDVAGARVRLRLRSPVVRVLRLPGDAGVQVDYVQDGALRRVVARHCVLACYHGMIPYLCPELPGEQKAAMHYGVKVPFLYTHVALRNWRAFDRLGVRQIVAPGSYHTHTALDFPVSIGRYRFPSHPDEPMVLFMMRAPCLPGLPRRDQYRAGRAELVQTPYEEMERRIRDQLQRMLGAAGFDAARDIAGITVNRWAHGYAYNYDSISDPAWPPGGAPHEVARRAFGPVTIANSDANASAFTDAAIDAAWRAVGELAALAPGGASVSS
jgi:spermidine dehydrogenase